MNKFSKLRINRLWLGVVTVCSVLILATVINNVRADQFDQQIQTLQNQNTTSQAASDQLAAQATGYQDAINKLQIQIDGLQAEIDANQQKSQQLQQQIVEAQAQLDHQKKVLGENIKQMYLEGQTSTLEILASSKDLSDFVDKQQARNVVSDKVKDTVDKINTLQAQLKSQQAQMQQLIKDQQAQNVQLSSAQGQQSQLLAYTQGQKAAYDQQIQTNDSQIASLRAAQLAANHSLGGTVVYSGACGGSYPADAAGPYGHWGCNYPKDNTADNFGMLNRECVSYTAWMVYKTFGHMPFWGGVGNANQWPGDAQASGIPTGSIPRANSVAIYTGGAYGHAMWVDGVSGSYIHVRQYNFNLDGNYSEMTINGSGLTYIYFQ